MPVTVVADEAIAGFNPNKLAEALQLDVKVAPQDPSQTIPLLDRLLEAVERAVRQMPDDKLDWTAPDRDRPMREFAYHIFMKAQRTMEEFSTGVVSPGSDLMGRSYASFQDIADYGRTIIEQYRTWAPKQDLDALSMPPPAGSNARNGAERLDLIAGHVTQHLRQLYFVLENFGIMPKNRLQDSELPPQYVLTILW